MLHFWFEGWDDTLSPVGYNPVGFTPSPGCHRSILQLRQCIDGAQETQERGNLLTFLWGAVNIYLPFCHR